jgi:lysophospholipase L1-like esterase
MDAIQSSMQTESTGLNFLLQTSVISYTQDGIIESPAVFYSLWDIIYNDYMAHKMASLYSSFDDVVLAAEQGTRGTSRYVFLMGGGVLNKLANGLWHGDIGSVTDATLLPATTYLAVGSTAVVQRTELCAETWHIIGSNTGARYWRADGSVFSAWNAAGKNLFIKADQTSGNIIDGVFIGATGQQVAFAGCYVSKVIPVTPGALIACHVAANQQYPVSFYDSGMAWVATFDKSVWHNETAGHYQVPAGAVYARVNAWHDYDDMTWFSIVSQSVIDTPALTNKKFVAMGDSVTNGVGTDTENIWWRLAAKADGYNSLVNLGIGGSLVTGLNQYSMSTRVATIDLDAKAVSFMGGINDWGNNVALGSLNDSSTLWQSSFYAALRYIAEYLRTHLPYAKVYWCTPQRFPTCMVQNTNGNTLEDFANAVLDVGREFGFVCVDFFHNVMVDLAAVPYNWLFLSDTLHMNVAGNRLLASCFIDYMHMNHATLGTEPVIYGSFSDLTSTARDRCMIAGGGVLRKINGLWLGDIGTFANSASLPSTATLAVGATARVGSAAFGYEMWYVYGANGTRAWRCNTSQYSVGASLKTGNLFVLADQTAENIIDNGYIGTDGNFVSTTAFYVSKPIPVTPGDLLAFTSAGGVNIPIAFYNASMVWISTPDVSTATKTTGHLPVPAGAAYARLNVSKAIPWYVFGVVNTNHEVSLTRPKKLVAIGDSISKAGTWATDADNIWWAIAAKAVGIETTVNLAVAGASLTNIVTTQFPQIPTDADIIQLLTGIPDYAIGSINLGTSSDRNGANTFYGWLDYTANTLLQQFPFAKMIWCTPTKYPGGLVVNGYGNTLEDYAEAVRLVATRYSITLVDFHDGLGIDLLSFRGSQLYLADTLHPNMIGNRQMANMYLPYLRGAVGITTRGENTGLGKKQTVQHALGISNMYDASLQTADNITDNAYIDINGNVVTATGLFFVSSFIGVLPGSSMSVYTGPGVDVPIAFYDSNLVWISTPTVTATRTYGQFVVPANAAWARLNVAKGYESLTYLYSVPTTTDVWWSKRVTKKFVAIGDSITRGYSTNDDNIWWKLSAKQAGYDYVVNMGADGGYWSWVNTGSVAYKVWAGLIPVDADVISIMGGVIDHSANFALGSYSDSASTYASSFYGSLKFTADYLRDKYPLAQIIWCTPIRYNAAEAANGQGYTLGDYAKAIITVGKSYGFTVVDFYNDMSQRLNKAPYSQLFVDGDGVHPNIAGNRLMSRFYTPYLESGGSMGVPYAATGMFGGSGGVTTLIDQNLGAFAELNAQVTAPATPASGKMRLWSRSFVGRSLPAFVEDSGHNTFLQPNFARNRIGMLKPAGNSTTMTAVGAALSGTGTATAANVAVTSKHTQMARIDYLVTTAATTAIAGFRVAYAQLFRGSAAGQGGFTIVTRWGNATGQTTSTTRCFVGLAASASARTDVNPTTLTDIVGMGWNSGDAYISIIYNDSSGTASTISLGANFPVPHTDRSNAYEIALFCPPNASYINYEVTDLASGARATGTLTTDIPSKTTLLTPCNAYMSVGGTSSVIGISLMSLYFETDD